MLSKLILLIAPSLALVLHLGACVQKRPEERVVWGGPDKVTNLVVFFKKEATREQVEGFKKSVLSKPRPGGRGSDMQDGMASQFRLFEAGYEGVGINFSTDATPEQRQRLKKNIQESPIVYKVLENVVPSDFKE